MNPKSILFIAVVACFLQQSVANASGIDTTASDSAKQAGGSQGLAQAASMITAGMMAAKCGPHNHMACAMAALAGLQAGSLGGTKSGSYKSADAFATDTGVSNGTTTSGTSATDTESILSGLASKGATVSADGKTMSFSDGSSMPLSSASSTGAMQAAGFGADTIAQAQKDIDEASALVNSKLKGMKLDGDGGGGGGAKAAAAPDFDGGGGAGGHGNQYVMVKRDRKKATLSGLSKNLGNDKIGVSGDNIFEMINRRYKAKDDAQGFIK